MADGIGALIDSLYTRLVLRDFVGKVVPGALALLCLGERFPLARDFITSQQLPWFALIGFGVGISWITALALQSLGEALRLIRYWPSNLDSVQQRYELRLRFLRVANPDEKQQAERFSLILEASAISSMSLLVAAATSTSHLMVSSTNSPRWPLLQGGTLLIILAVAAYSLWRLHRTHREKLYAFLRVASELRPSVTPVHVTVVDGNPSVEKL